MRTAEHQLLDTRWPTDTQEVRPGSCGPSGALSRPLGLTPITGLRDDVRPPRARISPAVGLTRGMRPSYEARRCAWLTVTGRDYLTEGNP